MVLSVVVPLPMHAFPMTRNTSRGNILQYLSAFRLQMESLVRKELRTLRKHFESAAIDVRLNPKMAMKRFDRLASGFEKALEDAAARLLEQGYSNVDDIRNRILKERGYR